MNNPIPIKLPRHPAQEKPTTNFIQKGSGAPVILIHGLAASLFDWSDLIPELANAGYAAYALDLLGHGESKKPASLDEYTIDNVFMHFCDWIESLKLDSPPVLIGHSLGGYLAIRFALNNPCQVRALILADPFYSIDQLPFLLRIHYKRPLINTALIEHTPQWLFRSIIDLTSLSIRNGHTLSSIVRTQTAADYKRAHPGIFNIIPSIVDISAQVGQLLQPTLILWGANDQTLTPNSFHLILNKFQQASGAAIAGAGHVPHQSHPLEFNQRVLKFLASLP